MPRQARLGVCPSEIWRQKLILCDSLQYLIINLAKCAVHEEIFKVERLRSAYGPEATPSVLPAAPRLGCVIRVLALLDAPLRAPEHAASA